MDRINENGLVASSFRDPSGFLFVKEGVLYRQVNTSYREDYDSLMGSGLYKTLADDGLLIPHQEVDLDAVIPASAYKVIKPCVIPFISYPYEWCFSQLKDAALTTLEVQKKALSFGLSLKDCSAYNIQFDRCKPVFIDTLSFERYREGEPWVAYKQFCQHFLAPLALMSCKDIRLNRLLQLYVDGVPLDLTSSLLPRSTRLNFSILTHIHLHAKAQRSFSDKVVDTKGPRVSQLSFRGLIDTLESAVRKLKWKCGESEWGRYYDDTNYSPEGMQHKKQIVSEILDKTTPGVVWDLGANVGMFSRLASDRGGNVISLDIDPVAVEKNYMECVEEDSPTILPVLFDLTNPSPGIGWGNNERMSLSERGPADMVFALALLHHLAISNNLPFSKIAEYLSTICASLIIEFIPKEDSQVQRLLATREDIFRGYTQRDFESEFKRKFTIEHSTKIKDSTRTIYFMKKRNE